MLIYKNNMFSSKENGQCLGFSTPPAQLTQVERDNKNEQGRGGNDSFVNNNNNNALDVLRCLDWPM
jgi:hypothetical protein